MIINRITAINLIKLVVVLLFVNGVSNAQNTFVKTITSYPTDAIKVDSFYYSIGTSYDKLVFTKSDLNGNVLVEKKFKGYDIYGFYINPNSIYHVKENGQHFFLLTAKTNNWVNDTAPIGYPYFISCNYVIKVNENGDSLWSMLYERGANLSFCLANDSDYIFTGGKGALIFKVDKNTGDTLWTKRYRYDLNAFLPFAYFYQRGVVNNGSGYTLTGGMLPTNRPQLMLSKTDYNGNLLWSKTYGDTTQNNNWGFTMTHDSGYVIIGQSAKDFLDTLPWTNFMLIRTDANGDTLWCRTYDYNNGVEVPCSIVETDDYGFAVVGYSSRLDSLGNWRNPSIMIKVDSMGNILWANKYGDYDGYPYNFFMTENGFLFSDGLFHQTDSNGVDCTSQPITVTMHYPVMTLTDSMPYPYQLTPQEAFNTVFYFHPPTRLDTVNVHITDYCINTGVEEQTVKQNVLVVYPNPTLNELAISSVQWSSNQTATVTIYDVMGKQKLQQNLTNNDGKLSLDVSGLSIGIYFLKVEQNGKIYNAKFVKE